MKELYHLFADFKNVTRNTLWNSLTSWILFVLLNLYKAFIWKSKFIFNKISQKFSSIQKALDWVLALINIERFISDKTADFFSILMILTYLVFIVTFYVILYLLLSNV